jgi:hypothetical protein
VAASAVSIVADELIRLVFVMLIVFRAASTLLEELESIADDALAFVPAASAASMLEEELDRYTELVRRPVMAVARVPR